MYFKEVKNLGYGSTLTKGRESFRIQPKSVQKFKDKNPRGHRDTVMGWES